MLSLECLIEVLWTLQIHSFPGFLTATIDDIQSVGVSTFLRILAFSIERIFCLSSSFVAFGTFLGVCCTGFVYF